MAVFPVCVAVAEAYFNSPSQAVLAYAANFPDGLCGGPLAYAMGAPLILTTDRYAYVAAEYTAAYDITSGIILGGPSLISDKSAIKVFAQADMPDTTEPPTEPTVPPTQPPTDPTTPTDPTETTPAPNLDAYSIYNAMIAKKTEYPEGMPWTNDNYYAWSGGIYSGGYGCSGFAFILSDAAFGDLPARAITPDPSYFYWVAPQYLVQDDEITIEDIRVGDILRVNGDTHSVIVLEVYDTHVIIAEGNYNNSIHWGRSLTAQALTQVDYILTRYPAE